METSVNNKCRAFTSLEQSRKLAEILPLESADMHYGNFSPKGLGYENKFSAGLTSYIKEIKVYEKLKESYGIKNYNGIVAWKVIPCWSLAALIEQLKSEIILENKQKLFLHLNKYNDIDHDIRYTNSWTGEVLITKGSNLVDACYEMIIKLNEQKLL